MPISASVNPVGVWVASAEGKTTITWSTNNVRAQVYLTVFQNTQVVQVRTFDGDLSGATSGSKELSVRYGHSYLLQVMSVDTNALLDALTVTVEARLPADPFPFGDAFEVTQAITDLKVRAGIDTAHVSFKTRQPTIPFVEATAADGTTLAASFPLFGGLRTEHEMLLGEVNALPQATEIKLKIVAAGHNILGQPREAAVNTKFTTGTRHAKIDFNEIKVWTDGDPGANGAGDFRWHFVAGDADNGARMARTSLEWDVDAGETLPIRKQLHISHAPRNLAVNVSATDDDTSILFAPGLGIVGAPDLKKEGTGEITAAEMDHAWVTQFFDIAKAPNGTVIPLDMATGMFAVAFTAKGRITITTTPGTSPLSFTTEDWSRVRTRSIVTGHGILVPVS